MMTSGAPTLPLGSPTCMGWRCRDNIIDGFRESLELDTPFIGLVHVLALRPFDRRTRVDAPGSHLNVAVSGLLRPP